MLLTSSVRKFGWIEDKKDDRDYKFSLPSAFLKKLPKEASVQPLCPRIDQQGLLGSCVGQAVKATISFAHVKQNLPDPNPAALMIYYTAREMEGNIYEDVGCSIRDALKGCAKVGVCSEKLWPYIIEKFAIRPTPECYLEAVQNKIISYHRIIPALTLLKGCIVEGYPFTVGIRVFENFPMELGDIPTPKGQEIGGHAVDIVGYNDYVRKFILRNSWGEEWGTKGYGIIPYEYILDPTLSMDFWTVRLVQ